MELTTAEMFCGIGGFRRGLEKSGWKTLWANDNDKYACKIYRKHYGDCEFVEADIQTIDADDIPDHTLLTAGFPCQAFSVAGKRKGFEDTRGTLFYDIARIAEAKRPPLLLLENVKGLLSNQKGYAFWKILQTLDELGYDVEWQVLNSKHFGVPQNRERVFIVGHLRGTGSKKIFPIAGSPKVAGKEPKKPEEPISTCIDGSYWKGADKHGQRTLVEVTEMQPQAFRVYDSAGVGKSITGTAGGVGAKTGLYIVPVLTNRARLKQEGRTVKNEDEPSFTVSSDCKQGVIVADRTRTYAGLGRKLESPKEVTNALSSVQKDNLLIFFSAHTNGNIRNRVKSESEALGGAETRVVVPRFDGRSGQSCLKAGRIPEIWLRGRIRRLTPVECERLQGFPDGWTEGVSDTQRYRLLGNAVTVNVIEFLGARLIGCLQ